MSVIHRLSQLDTDNAGYAEKLLQASTVGQYCKRLVGIMQVQSTLIESAGVSFLPEHNYIVEKNLKEEMAQVSFHIMHGRLSGRLTFFAVAFS